MGIRNFFIIAGVLAAAGAGDGADAELKKLHGVWNITSIETNSKEVEPGKGAPERIVVTDEKATFSAGGDDLATMKNLSLHIIAGKNPCAIDLIRGEREILPCIYEVAGDELKLAMPIIPPNRNKTDPLPRPDSFDTKGKPVLVLRAKRGAN